MKTSRICFASTVWRLPVTLAAVCFAIAVMTSVSNRAIAATETPLAATSTTSCPHQLDKDGKQWKPADSELHLILARHFGYWFRQLHPDLDLQNADDASLKDAYLDRTFPDWRKEARKNPERANLCNADLSGANLPNANLSGAELADVNLSGARPVLVNLSGALLLGANLSGANPVNANLSGAVLFEANLSGAGLSGAELARRRSRREREGSDLLDTAKPDPSPIIKPIFAWIEGVLRWIGFDGSTAYGLYPGRALALILLLGIILTPVYMPFMRHPTQKSRIVRVFPQDRVDIIDAESPSEQERMASGGYPGRRGRDGQ